LHEQILTYQSNYLARWTKSGIDALVVPVQPYVGFPPKVWVKSSQYVGYTAHWNLLNYASLTIPVTHVDAELDRPDEEWLNYQPRDQGSDEFNWMQCE
jgi:amidase